MGHHWLRTIPTTREWKHVAALINAGADPDQIANASIRAAEQGFLQSSKDIGVLETLFLMLRLPHAARQPAFDEGLRECGLIVKREPTLTELIAGVSDAIDNTLSNCRHRTDLGEMAQMALVESLAKVFDAHLNQQLFDTPQTSLQQCLARYATVVQLGAFARAFFSRFTFKCLDYYLGRVTKLHVGVDRRFYNLDEQATYMEVLERHCYECALIVTRYTGEWNAKQRYEHGEVDRDLVRAYAHGAMRKMIKALRREVVLREQ